jgi:hypothetical protein
LPDQISATSETKTTATADTTKSFVDPTPENNDIKFFHDVMAMSISKTNPQKKTTHKE